MVNNYFKLFSLLYVNLDREQNNVNLDKKIENQIDIYINCGRLLAASCRYFDIPYAIVTNDVTFVRERVAVCGGGVDVVGGSFDRAVPVDAAFHSAHYKLDLLRSFGMGEFGDFVGLIDLDVVLTKPIDYIGRGDFSDSLVVYDISKEERESYSDMVIKTSLMALTSDVSDGPFWFGGELIIGRSEMFKKLSSEIDRIWPLYEESYKKMHHVGDEMVVTAALGALKISGVRLLDAGNPIEGRGPLIQRWWSGRTLCKQVSLEVAAKAAILHLPADKPFLAEMAGHEYNPQLFLKCYRRYARKRLFVRRLLNPLLNLREGRRLFVASV